MSLTSYKYCYKGHLACPYRSCKYCKRITKEPRCADTELINAAAPENFGATPQEQKPQTSPRRRSAAATAGK